LTRVARRAGIYVAASNPRAAAADDDLRDKGTVDGVDHRIDAVERAMGGCGVATAVE
jgi:hypothetical protein